MGFDDFKHNDKVVFTYIIYRKEDPNPENEWVHEARKGEGTFDKWIDAVRTHSPEEKPPHDRYAMVGIEKGKFVRVLLEDLFNT